MSTLASLFSWPQPEPVFELEPGTPPVNPCLLEFGAMFTGDSNILTDMLVLIPTLSFVCVILWTRLDNL
ncbi:hypothetical protein FANTH_11901 [Fusarium anthophilum]|uniref:Uncharacterized protein n=1 Tax=Fusarium anthophilum TaxID=48485 RepID=A0A8H4YVB4_9HYPO|nr:hypothetical protein FANTH_11901 [Fusarium anthophilum]